MPMPSQKDLETSLQAPAFRKAYNTCHVSKVKCKPSTGSIACARCIRLGISCKYSPPIVRASTKRPPEQNPSKSTAPYLPSNAPSFNGLAEGMDGIESAFWTQFTSPADSVWISGNVPVSRWVGVSISWTEKPSSQPRHHQKMKLPNRAVYPSHQVSLRPVC